MMTMTSMIVHGVGLRDSAAAVITIVAVVVVPAMASAISVMSVTIIAILTIAAAVFKMCIRDRC